MAAKKRSYTPYMRKKKHPKTGYYARLGRKGGNTTKARRRPAFLYYSRIGKKGGEATRRKHP